MRARMLLIATILIGTSSYVTADENTKRPTPTGEMPTNSIGSRPSKLPLPVNLETLPASMREMLGKIIQHPTITAVAPAEEFTSTGEMYLWLLDHPHRVSCAWQRLNVGAIDIVAMRDGRFTWKDEQGSELTWQTVAKCGEGRIWFAEGKVRPGMLLPSVAVKAVAVLRHGIRKDAGDCTIRHQVEVFLQTDSKAAAIVAKMIGAAAPKMAEQGAEQLLLFFSGIAKYVDRNPTKAEVLLAEKK